MPTDLHLEHRTKDEMKIDVTPRLLGGIPTAFQSRRAWGIRTQKGLTAWSCRDISLRRESTTSADALIQTRVSDFHGAWWTVCRRLSG